MCVVCVCVCVGWGGVGWGGVGGGGLGGGGGPSQEGCCPLAAGPAQGRVSCHEEATNADHLLAHATLPAAAAMENGFQVWSFSGQPLYK